MNLNLLSGNNNRLFFVWATFVVFACNKNKVSSQPPGIMGSKEVCPGDSGLMYSISTPDPEISYVWTVPPDATIMSGQGTSRVFVKFGKNSGDICVSGTSGKNKSEATCIGVNLNGSRGQWCYKTTFPGAPRYLATAFSLNGKGYVGLGKRIRPDLFEEYLNDFWEFDPVRSSWRRLADFPGTPRSDAIAFVINNKGYVGTGNSGTAYESDFWEYDPAKNSWMKKRSLPQGRAFSVAFTIGNKGFVGFGKSETAALKNLLEYDPTTDRWTNKEGLSILEVIYGVGFSIGNKGYIGTGLFAQTTHPEFWEYDPTDSVKHGKDDNGNPSGSWQRKKDLDGGKRQAAVGFSLNGKGYILGGDNLSNHLNDLWQFESDINGGTGTWTKKPDFSGVRAYACCFVIGDRVYVGTGKDPGGKVYNDFWVYSP